MLRLFYIAILATFSITKLEAASLSFSPQRIVLEESSRSATLRLTNTGNELGTFRIYLSDVIYNEDGSVKHSNTPPANFPSARKYVRISPSQVTLQAGESQTVRVLLRLPKTFKDGEYRIHAVLKQLPNAQPLDRSDPNKPASVTLSQAVAIPIIARRGTSQAKATLASARRTPEGVSLLIARKGNKSLYTNIEVYAGSVSPSNRISLTKGFAVPVPNQRRKINISLKNNAARPYIVQIKDSASGKVLTQTSIP